MFTSMKYWSKFVKNCENCFLSARSKISSLYHQYMDRLMQERRKSIAIALELRLTCINPLIWSIRYEISIYWGIHRYIAIEYGWISARLQYLQCQQWRYSSLILIRWYEVNQCMNISYTWYCTCELLPNLHGVCEVNPLAAIPYACTCINWFTVKSLI